MYLCAQIVKKMDDNSQIIQWFCIGCTSKNKELKIRDDARKYGLEAFVPLRYEVKRVKKQKQRTLVPAIAGLMFVKGTEDEVKDYISNAHYTIFIRKSTFSNKEEYLTIPLRAMENFIAVTEDHEAHITYFRPEEIKLQPGDQIRIKGGIYDGKEGTVMRIKGKRNKHLVVQIPGILIAAVELSPELIELRPKDEEQEVINEKPSKNIEGDKKLLFDNAYRLLFDISDKYKDDSEYYLLLSEMKRARARLITFKGFTPTTEAELALPMYMAAVVLAEGVVEAEERLKKATEKLKDTSKLKFRCQSILKKLAIKNE